MHRPQLPVRRRMSRSSGLSPTLAQTRAAIRRSLRLLAETEPLVRRSGQARDEAPELVRDEAVALAGRLLEP